MHPGLWTQYFEATPHHNNTQHNTTTTHHNNTTGDPAQVLGKRGPAGWSMAHKQDMQHLSRRTALLAKVFRGQTAQMTTDKLICARCDAAPPGSEPEPSLLTENCEKKQTNAENKLQDSGCLCTCQAPPWVVSSKRPNPALRAHPECSTAWYRRRVPNRSTTKTPRAGWVGGWVGAVFPGSPPTHHPINLP